MHPLLLRKAIRATLEGRLGDAAVYKAVALAGQPCPAVLRAVRALENPLPDFASRLAEPLPEGSVGKTFALFAGKFGITPLSISSAVRHEVAELNLVAARYVLVHDLFHVLLGFDTSRSGELAVWSFVAGQHYIPSYERAARLAALLYPLAEPSARSKLNSHRQKGIALARVVPSLITQPLEQYWLQPLRAARVALGIFNVDDT